jgi:hypothetical protein
MKFLLPFTLLTQSFADPGITVEIKVIFPKPPRPIGPEPGVIYSLAPGGR